MQNRRLAGIIVMCLLAGAASAIMVQIPQADIQSQADAIVTGTVTGVSSQWNQDRTAIYTDVTIAVEQADKGNVDRDVVVRVPGGEADDIGMAVEDVPVFSVGQQVKLYLARTSTDVFELVANGQGGMIDARPVYYYSYSGYHRDPASCYYKIWSGLPSDWSSAIQAGASTWSAAGSAFRFYYNGTHGTSGTVYDGVNCVSRGNLGSGGILAQNSFWYSRRTKLVAENDIVFNTYYPWSTSGASGYYDVQNIGTHEIGHCLVLDDIYKSYQSEMTMYGYGGLGETKKSTLESGDIDGIKYIYGVGFDRGVPALKAPAVTD
jgi:Matrixin